MTYATCRRGQPESRSNPIEVGAHRNEDRSRLARDYALVRIADGQRNPYHGAAPGRRSILPAQWKDATR